MSVLQRETLKYNRENSDKVRENSEEQSSSDDESSTDSNADMENKNEVVKPDHALRLWNCSRLRKRLYLCPF